MLCIYVAFLIFKGFGYVLLFPLTAWKAGNSHEFASPALAVFSDSSPTTIIIFSTSSFLSRLGGWNLGGETGETVWFWKLTVKYCYSLLIYVNLVIPHIKTFRNSTVETVVWYGVRILFILCQIRGYSIRAMGLRLTSIPKPCIPFAIVWRTMFQIPQGWT